MQRLGRSAEYRYHILRHGWNAYLRLVGIDYHSNFTCPSCKDTPDVIILDGVAMGTSRDIPETLFKVDKTQHYPLVKFSERTFISDSALRKELFEYCKVGLSESKYNKMVKSISIPEFSEYIQSSSVKNDNKVSINPDYPNARKIIEYLNHAEPITGVLQFSILNKDELQLVVQLTNGKAVKKSNLQPIYKKMYILELLFTSLDVNSNSKINPDFFTLNPLISCLLKFIIQKINSLCKRPSRKPVEIVPNNEDYFNYFPAFRKNYM